MKVHKEEERAKGSRQKIARASSIALALTAASVLGCSPLVELQPGALAGGSISAEQEARGLELLKEVTAASGGIGVWRAFEVGCFEQTADWHGVANAKRGWKVDPQPFRLSTPLGTEDGTLDILEGPCAPGRWQRRGDGITQLREPSGKCDADTLDYKVVYKAYWFQFPFRIVEAPIVAYGGDVDVEGITYHTVFATWGSAEANRDYDQFVLYIHPETHHIEWLEFTAREVAAALHMTAHFSDFETTQGITLPKVQAVSSGKPGGNGLRMHTNTYHTTAFGVEACAALMDPEG